jgi:CO/xanthine dehydrogenase FAD-binding subunit
VKPPAFDYVAPTSVAEAVSLLAEHDFDAKILAGGQSLMPLLNMRLARPGILIDVARIPDLDYIRDDGDAFAIGTMTRQRSVELSEVVRKRHPLLYAATMQIAHPQNRNQGTVGGSLAHADPAAELPALAVALDAEFKAVGPDGERVIAADDFFVTYLTTSLESTEILTEVRMPVLHERTGWSVMEVARRHGDFALAGVIATLSLDGEGHCAASHVVMFGVDATPVRAREAEHAVIGEKPVASLFELAGEKGSAEIEEPMDDVHANAEYRRDLARVLVRRALTEAAERAAAVL